MPAAPDFPAAADASTAPEIEALLRRRVRGEVRFDAAHRALYASDASSYRQVPIGVVFPRDADDVAAAVDACRELGAPILPRGAGTSLAGQCVNVAVVLDFTRHMDRVLEIDPGSRTARVEPGCVLDDLQAAARPHALVFGPDPATHATCTLGGMIGNNSCGVHSVTAGRTSDNVEELDVLLPDGTRMTVGRTSEAELDGLTALPGTTGAVHAALRRLRDRTADLVRARFPRIPRRVSGYNLDELLPENGCHVARALTGTEGTCVTVLGARVRLVERPAARALLLLGYPDIADAGDDAVRVRATGVIGLEGMDDLLLRRMESKRLLPGSRALLPAGGGWLVAEYGGASAGEAAALAEAAARRLASPAIGGRVVAEPREQARIWRLRESVLGATVAVPGERDLHEGWEDSAVPPERMGAYLRDLRHLLDRHGYTGFFYGHFGDGCLHARITFDLRSGRGAERFGAFLEEAADLVVGYGGSLSGEHGDGQARARLLPRMFGEKLVEAFGEFKRIWDPDGRMNPGKVVDARGPTEDLRLVDLPHPAAPARLLVVSDRGSLTRAAERCIGIGRCRRTDGAGVMCPSFAATRDEMHSTRGRARLLQEMLRGEVVRGGFRDEAVKQALDLCLSCKACKSECPAGVDMAAYRAEFLRRYWEGRLRPRAAYTMGQVGWWARVLSHAPRLVNAAATLPYLGDLLRTAAGIHPARRLPRFAPQTFRGWWRRHLRTRAAAPRPLAARRVLLFPDTFTDVFRPEAGRAAVRVLEAAGYVVEVPRARACCGRPLHDWGMLDLARRTLADLVAALLPWIRDGVPVVVLEPSCASVLRDDMASLLADDPAARRLRERTVTLPELLAREVPDLALVRRPGRAVVQFHCHQTAVLGTRAEREVLGRLGFELEDVPGCCGMAGAFGFARETHDVSLRIAERALLPAVRAAAADTLILADGFSCKEQIEQATGRPGLHLAEVVARALEPPAMKR